MYNASENVLEGLMALLSLWSDLDKKSLMRAEVGVRVTLEQISEDIFHSNC